jgi:mannose-6-phosphate isomerase-like protein (cupin superfamily)
MRSDTTHGRADLDGGCFVLTPSPEDGALTSGWRVVPTIGPEDGADRLSQYLLKPDESQTGSLGFGGAEVVLFVAAGEAEIDISERAFAAPLHSAVSIRPGEAFLARTKSPSQTTIIATVCPPAPMTADARGRFDEAFPDRTTPATIVERHSMGDRNYQVLTSELTGASEITQFIGGIPRSRAAVHRHLYEEALYILSGEGMMWTETRKAAVRSGDVIYLPRKQLHSLECTTPDGMVLAGSFFPAGSPAINY